MIIKSAVPGRGSALMTRIFADRAGAPIAADPAAPDERALAGLSASIRDIRGQKRRFPG